MDVSYDIAEEIVNGSAEEKRIFLISLKWNVLEDGK